MVTAQFPVQVFVSESTIRVDDETPASFFVAMEIAEGHRIVAALPGESAAAGELFPLRVGLINGQGVAVYADYPDGQSHTVEELGAFEANSGRIEFEVAIEKAPGIGAGDGDPVIGVSFQVCNDQTCQGPQTIRLEVAVEIG